MRSQQRWRDLSEAQRRGAIGAGVVQLILLATALFDLVRRPSEQVRGRKWLWGLACLVNFVGPLSHLAFGRRRPPTSHAIEQRA